MARPLVQSGSGGRLKPVWRICRFPYFWIAPGQILDDTDGRSDSRSHPLRPHRPGTRLPSSRRLSEQLMISRNTVVRAYDLLLMEGIVESRPASGIYVAEALPRMPRRSGLLPNLRDFPLAPADAVAAASGARAPPAHAGRNRLLYDFFPGRPSADLFPLKTWRRLLQANLSHGGGAGLTQYGDPAGLACAAHRDRQSSGGRTRHRRRPQRVS